LTSAQPSGKGILNQLKTKEKDGIPGKYTQPEQEEKLRDSVACNPTLVA
jgi:hypothetical protein